MGRRRLRGALAAASAASVILASLVAGSAAQAAVQGAALPTVVEGQSSFDSCVAGGGQPDILMLIDESGSLRQSDPEFARMTSALFVIDKLADSADRSEAPVSVQIAVFGEEYRVLQDWTELSSSTVQSVRQTLLTLPEYQFARDTDYWTALDGSRRDLAARAADSGSDVARCQLILWLSDGAIDFEAFGSVKAFDFAPGVTVTPENREELAAQAAADICRSGGLADQVRSSGIEIIGVGLNGVTSEVGDFALMERASAGARADGSEACGDLGAGASGRFFLATDLDSLLFAFDEIGNAGRATVSIEGSICQVEVCLDRAHRFVLDASTPVVSILASAQAAAPAVVLTAPGIDSAATVPPRTESEEGSVSLGSAEVSYQWESDATVSIELDKAGETDAAWTGQWALSYVDPSGESDGNASRSNIHITPDLSASWEIAPEPGQIRRGDDATIAFSLRTTAGDDVDAESILGTLSIEGQITDAAGAVTELPIPDDAAAFAEPITIPDTAGIALGSALITVTLRLTTAAVDDEIPGTALSPVMVSSNVLVVAPLDYPTVASRIDFGEIEGPVALAGALPLAGAGCVWLETGVPPTVIAQPESVGAVTLSSAANDRASCVDPANVAALDVILTTEAEGTGAINGSFTVLAISSTGDGGEIEYPVEFTADVQRPLNTLNFLLTLIVAAILGPGLPLAFLYLFKWLSARIPARSLAASLVPVQVSDSFVLRDGAPFQVSQADSVGTVLLPAGGARRAIAAGIELRTRTGLSPFGAGFVTVEAPGTLSAARNTAISASATAVTARLPLAVHNSWVLLRRPGDPAGSASILLLLGADLGPERTRELEQQIQSRVPDLMREFARIESGTGSSGSAQDSSAGATGPFAPPAQQQGGGWPGQDSGGWPAPQADGWSTPAPEQTSWGEPQQPWSQPPQPGVPPQPQPPQIGYPPAPAQSGWAPPPVPPDGTETPPGSGTDTPAPPGWPQQP